MLGAVCCGPKVRGALGFSNEKSFVYWARTENFGPACGVSAPLPFCSAISTAPRTRPEHLLAVVWAIAMRLGSPSMAPLSRQARANDEDHRNALTRLSNAWLA